MPKVRVWKLGSVEDKVLPSDNAVRTLSQILMNWDRATDLDIVWDPFIDVQQFDAGEGSVDVIEDGPRIRVVTEAGEVIKTFGRTDA